MRGVLLSEGVLKPGIEPSRLDALEVSGAGERTIHAEFLCFLIGILDVIEYYPDTLDKSALRITPIDGNVRKSPMWGHRRTDKSRI